MSLLMHIDASELLFHTPRYSSTLTLKWAMPRGKKSSSFDHAWPCRRWIHPQFVLFSSPPIYLFSAKDAIKTVLDLRSTCWTETESAPSRKYKSYKFCLKSIFLKFDQVYTTKHQHLQYKSISIDPPLSMFSHSFLLLWILNLFVQTWSNFFWPKTKLEWLAVLRKGVSI